MWIRVTYYWETHIWGSHTWGQHEVCARGGMESMGDWQSATRRCDLPGSACSTLGMLEARLTLSKVTMDSGDFGCLSVGVHELLRT